MKESQLNMKNRFAFTSLQAVIYTGSPLSGLGYRWVYMDYETGSGASRFKYDLLNQGAQLGFMFHF